MSSPQARLRPAAPAAHRLADVVASFDRLEVALPTTQDRTDDAITGWASVEVRGATMDSADVQEGDLFIAVPGRRVHGATFVGDAVAAGAVAVLTDAAGVAQIASGPLGRSGLPVLVTSDPRALAGSVAASVHDSPGSRLVTVGVTGTNGKTTTTYLVDAALRAAHRSTALLGTVETRLGDRSTRSVRTTVEAPALHAALARACELGVTAVTMEVSSHALALGRVNGLVLDVAGFTNLQRDHLDFHGGMEEYFRAKAQLFTPAHARCGVVVVDDAWGRRLADEATIDVETVSTHPGDHSGDWSVARAVTASDGVGTVVELRSPEGAVHRVTSPLPGSINVSNTVLAVVLAHRAGVPLDDAIRAIAASPGVPGRMERVLERGDGRPLALVDYAHTPDALGLVLDAVRPVTPGRVIVVFGAGGDRDRGKRVLMGEAAGRHADIVIVTDDNPRSEAPAAIRGEIVAGARAPGSRAVRVDEVADRTEAISLALRLAQEDDTIVVAGKGHEVTQEIGGVTHAFSDQEALRATVRHERPGRLA